MITALIFLFAVPVSSANELSADIPTPGENDTAEEEWDIRAAHGTTHEQTIETNEGTWMSVSVHANTVVFDLLGDIWSIPLSGGDATQLTDGPAWDSEPRFSPDGTRIAFVSDGGGNEQLWLMEADGSDAKAFTKEKNARVTDPVWDPDGPWMIGRRRTVDTRSIGVTELWQYHLDGGDGFALTSKDDHPHAGESTTDGERIWFSSRHGRFSYDSNPLKGLWRIMRLDRKTGQMRAEISGNGSAVRPMALPDGSGLVFVTRDRNKTHLEHLDFETRKRRVIADWLDHDQMEGFALHGVYPSMDWTPSGDLVLWAKGRLWRVSLDGTQIEIPFQARGVWQFHDVPRWNLATPDTVQAKVIRWPSVNRFGDLAFSAMGRVAVQGVAGKTKELGGGFAPAWSSDGNMLTWTSWSDKDKSGRLHITHGRGYGRTETLPIQGQLVNPSFGPNGSTLVVLRDPNTDNNPNMGSIPWYELMLLRKRGGRWTSTVLKTTVGTGVGFRAPQPRIHDGRIWWLDTGESESRKPNKSNLVSVDLNGTDRQDHLVFDGAVQASPSPDFTRIAYKLGHQAWVTAMPQPGKKVSVSALPQFQLTEIVGDWMAWTANGQGITWAQGPTLYTHMLDGSSIPQTPDEDDTERSSPEPEERPILFEKARASPQGTTALTHATVLPMDGSGPIEDATVVIVGNRIHTVAAGGPVPAGATEIDLQGKTIIPGLIDVHAHLHYGSGDVLPEQPWQYSVNLDFGVTTVHDPSASTDLVFTQAERVAAGLSDGPRVYSTGYILYGALGNENAKTPDKDAAHQHVQRLKTVGANSVKVYQQSQRKQRQWYVDACNTHQMLCVAEGGGDLWQDLSMVSDGFQAIEHALPNAPLYSDIQQFMAASKTTTSAGTAYTPTLLVAYGGLSGEIYYYQHQDPYDDARLLQNWDRRDLDARTYRGGQWAHDGDWNHQQAARDAAQMQEKGLLVTLGAHGQLQGLGVHWELWALGGPGAMSPMNALKAGTIDGARYLGMDSTLGSVTAGKLADLVVLDADPREDLQNTTRIHMVIHNGTIRR
jgi:imidazolonepropionase-like amidohydrolase/Tol biopolymer transport system component